MNTEEFLEKVLGQGDWYCAAGITTDKIMIQKFYASHAEVIAASKNFEAQGINAFFGTATLQTPNNRTAANAASMATFFLDIDCGPDYPYKNQDEGYKALRKFCVATGLPRPLVVNSGRGLHVYWLLTEPATISDWAHVAERFKKVCMQQEFKIDFAVPADAARILRVPNTSNFKQDPPLPVFIEDETFPAPLTLEAFGNILGVTEIPEGLGFNVLPVDGSETNATMEAMMGNSRSDFKAIITKSVRGTGCGQLKLIATDQEHCSEPMWRAGLSIAKHCDDPLKGARNISNKHPEYTVEATERKMGDIKGPYTCEVFNENNPNVCPECPHWGKIKSPIQLGKYIAEADPEDNIVEEVDPESPEGPVITYEIPPYPKPYFRGAKGGVYIRKKTNEVGEDGAVYEDIAVYHNDLYVVKRLKDVEAGECVVMRLHLPQDGVSEFMMPLSAITSKDELRKELSKQGVAVPKVDLLLHYITTWINQLQATTMAENAHRRFGWVGTGYKQFIAGPYDIRPNKVLVNHPSAATAGMVDYFKPKGSIEVWKEVIEFYNRPGFEMHQYVVCRALGSLIMRMSTYNGCTLHLYSKIGGRGKTTSAYVGLGMYGSPKGLALHESDTMASRMNRAEVYNSIMLLFDEITNAEPKPLSEMTYQITSGEQRNRMSGNNNVERHRADPWHLLTVTTGNTSLLEVISGFKTDPRAEAQRVLECEVPALFDEKDPIQKAETDAFTIKLHNNYGHGLIPFVQHIMQDPDRAEAIVSEIRTRIDTSAGLGPEYRYWSADGTMTLAGGLLGQEIGIIPYDMPALFKYTVNMIRENRRAALAMGSTTQETFNEFIYEHMANMLQITSTTDLRGGGGMEQLAVPNMQPKGALIVRYETDTKRAFVITKNLRAWCIKQQINYNSFRKELIKTMDGNVTKIRLSKGTALDMPPTNVISVACDIPVQELIDATNAKDE